MIATNERNNHCCTALSITFFILGIATYFTSMSPIKTPWKHLNITLQGLACLFFIISFVCFIKAINQSPQLNFQQPSLNGHTVQEIQSIIDILLSYNNLSEIVEQLKSDGLDPQKCTVLLLTNYLLATLNKEYNLFHAQNTCTKSLESIQIQQLQKILESSEEVSKALEVLIPLITQYEQGKLDLVASTTLTELQALQQMAETHTNNPIS